MESIANSIQGLVMNLVVAAIFFIGKYIAKSISEIVAKTMARRDTDPALIGFVKSLLRWALLGFVAIAALGQLGIQTASFVAIIGAAGLARFIVQFCCRCTDTNFPPLQNW
jgi:small conductance mechanosensitive channel